ncbi:MAG: restriction endonuclease subunit S [Pseudomonadota bacterium]
MSELNQRSLATLGELADEPVEQTGPMSDFVYVDISSIDRETKKITEAKALTLAQAPSRAKQLLRAGDVLVSMTRPNLNAVALVPEQLDGAIGSTGFHVLRSRWLRPEFLFRLVQSQRFVDEMSALVQGALYPAVRPKDIAAFTFAFETPAQQSRIVAKIEELLSDLDAGVAELKAAQKKLGQYRQSLLKAAVEGALTADWRAQNTPSETGAQLLQRILTERRARWEAKQRAKFAEQGKTPPKDWQKKYPEPAQPDITDLPELPEGWVWASVEQLGDVQLGRQRSPDKLKGISPTRYIRAANITEAGIDFSDVLEMDFSEQERNTFELHVGDVLLTEASGSAEHVGRPAIWPNVDGLYCFQNTVLRFQPQGVGSEFAFYSFLAMQKLGVFRRLSGGVGINHLSAGKFSRLPVAIPWPDEQVEIVRALAVQFAAIEEQGQAIELSFKQSTAQRQNILRAAFAGQLVPQDPNDEPASILLERIRAERAARESAKKPRGQRKINQDQS